MESKPIGMTPKEWQTFLDRRYTPRLGRQQRTPPIGAPSTTSSAQLPPAKAAESDQESLAKRFKPRAESEQEPNLVELELKKLVQQLEELDS